MSDRVLRDELLDSDRYWALPSDTHRMLFTHLVLTADDLGNAEAGTGAIRRRLLQREQPISAEAAAKLLTELQAVDIIRLFEVDGKRYAHIPRFRQRLRSYKRVNPRPPSKIEDKEINELMEKLSGTSQSDDRQLPDTCGRRKEGRKETKNYARDAQPVDNFSAGAHGPPKSNPTGKGFPKVNGNGQAHGARPLAAILRTAWRSHQAGIAQVAAYLELAPNPGESWEHLGTRCTDEIARRKASPT